MNLSPIGSSNSEPSIALNNTTIEAEKQLAAAEKQALEAGKHLPAHKQNEYNLMVRRGANQIRLQISKMKSQGKIEYDISLTVKVLVKDFNASMNGFIEKNRAYDSAKTQVNRNYQLMTSRLENLSSTFTPIQRQFFYDEFSDDEVDYNEDLSFNDEEHVSFESSLPTFTEKACNFNSVTKKVCYATGLLSKAPNALILTASLNAGTDNIAGNFMLNKPDLSSFKKIETRFDTKYLQISDTKSLCRAIDNEKANGVAII